MPEDTPDQTKEELHLNPNEAEHGTTQATTTQKPESGSAPSKWAPQTYGDAAAAKIDSTLGVVGHPVGKGLATVTAPLGNVVDAAVGGLTRAGGMAYSDSGMGKEQDQAIKDDEVFRKEVGGKEQTGGNPLGL